MYGEGAVTAQMYQKCFAQFCAGDFSLNNAPRSDRPVEVDRDQIKILTENNQHYTMLEIANILKIAKSVKLSVKMKNVLFILWKKTYGLFGQPNKMLLRFQRTGRCSSGDNWQAVPPKTLGNLLTCSSTFVLKTLKHQ